MRWKTEFVLLPWGMDDRHGSASAERSPAAAAAEHAMASSSPEQVIRALLPAQGTPVASQPISGTTAWRSETATLGFDAKPETFQFGKVHRNPKRQLHAVIFETHTGQRVHFTCCVRQDQTGDWQFVGGAGGAANGDPRRSPPWVSLGGGWPKQCYARGHVQARIIGRGKGRARAPARGEWHGAKGHGRGRGWCCF